MTIRIWMGRNHWSDYSSVISLYSWSFFWWFQASKRIKKPLVNPCSKMILFFRRTTSFFWELLSSFARQPIILFLYMGFQGLHKPTSHKFHSKWAKNEQLGFLEACEASHITLEITSRHINGREFSALKFVEDAVCLPLKIWHIEE